MTPSICLPAAPTLPAGRIPRSASPSWWYRLATVLLLYTCLWLAGCAGLPAHVQRTPSSALAQPEQTALGQMVATRRAQAQTAYHSAFALLGGAEAAYTGRLALIRAAQKTLDIQYYAIHADASTTKLLQEIAQAAARGVRVRILLDDFHSAGKDAQVMRMAFVPGVEMRMFNPVMGARGSPPLRALSTLTDFTRTQQRMHNKQLIADNMVGIAGGRNLGDAYFDALDSDNFIDLDMLAAGAVVRQLSRSFDSYWNNARAYPVESLLSLAELDAMLSPAQQARLQAQQTRPQSQADAHQAEQAATQQALLALPPMDLQSLPWTWAPGLVLADRPAKIALADNSPTAADALSETTPATTSLIQANTAGRQHAATTARAATGSQQALSQILAPVNEQDNVVDGLLALVEMARSKLLIVSPYFVPGEGMKDAFARAIARGVQVRILTNSLASNDAPLAHAGYARHRKALLTMGVELYELRSLQTGTAHSTLRSAASQVNGSSGASRAMLHSKLMVLDEQLTVVGSMNLDMRSQLQNTEIALLVASRQLSAQALQHINATLAENAWHVTLGADGKLLWQAPPERDWGDQSTEPDASLPLRMMIHLIGPLAPDHLL